jgi:hypothetical protein
MISMEGILIVDLVVERRSRARFLDLADEHLARELEVEVQCGRRK